MLAKKSKPQERRGQPSHRKDLRSQLVSAAAEIVTHHGHEALSIRRLAEVVGVSPGAPYHHFADRRTLLIAVALKGYQDLLDDIGALAKEPADEETLLFRSLLSFIRFAVANPHMFTLMYESELVRPTLSPELAVAHEQGFQFLRREVANLATGLSERDVSIRVATIWSAIFGFALQSNRAMLRPHPSEPVPDELAPEVVRQVVRLLA